MNKEIMQCRTCEAYFNVLRCNECCGIRYIDEYYDKYPIVVDEVKEKPVVIKKSKKYRRPSLSKEARLDIIVRDNYTCQDCSQVFRFEELQVHHIIYKSNGGTDIPKNLLTLCKLCHLDRHEGEPVYSIMIKNIP